MPALVQRPMSFGGAVARATLVVAPLLAFRVFPLPGIVTLGMVLPLIVLVGNYLATPRVRVPTWELALLGLLSLSVLWGDDPDYSVERLRTYLPLVLATTFAGCLVSAETLLRCLKASFAVIIASSLLNLMIDPTGLSRAGSSDLVATAQFSKNVFGGLLVIALVLLVDTRRRINLLLVPALVVLLALNQSVTAWVVAFALVMATYASRHAIRRFGPRFSKVVLTVMALIGLGGVALLAVTNFDSAVGTLGKDPTIGKRTEIWAASWEQVKTAPVLGHGAFTFLDSASNSPVTQFVWSRFQNFRPPHPHNGLIDLAGQLGLVGVVAYGGLVLDGIRRGAHAAVLGRESARTAVLCLLFVVAFGATEPTYLGPWLVITLMCVGIVHGRTDATSGTEGASDRRSPRLRPVSTGRS